MPAVTAPLGPSIQQQNFRGFTLGKPCGSGRHDQQRIAAYVADFSIPEPCLPAGVASNLPLRHTVSARTYSRRPGTWETGAVTVAATVRRKRSCAFAPAIFLSAGLANNSKVTIAEIGLPGRPKKRV